jgi:hypothetical protein
MTTERLTQRRGQSLSMTSDEMNAFLASQKVCRVATVKPTGSPDVTPLFFVWDCAVIWIYSLCRSQRWRNLERDARVAVVIDAGLSYEELQGVEITGVVEVIGDVPRSHASIPELLPIERAFADKYGAFVVDSRHAWLRLSPQRVISWDFAKIQATR